MKLALPPCLPPGKAGNHCPWDMCCCFCLSSYCWAPLGAGMGISGCRDAHSGTNRHSSQCQAPLHMPWCGFGLPSIWISPPAAVLTWLARHRRAFPMVWDIRNGSLLCGFAGGHQVGRGFEALLTFRELVGSLSCADTLVVAEAGTAAGVAIS